MDSSNSSSSLVLDSSDAVDLMECAWDAVSDAVTDTLSS